MTLTGLLQLVIWLIALGLIVWLALWVLQQLAPAEPFAKIARIIVVVIACIILIYLLLGLVGGGGVTLPAMK